MRKTRQVISDELWNRIQRLLPKPVPSLRGGRPPADDRECLEGIVWPLRSGARWRDILVDLPAPVTGWRRLLTSAVSAEESAEFRAPERMGRALGDAPFPERLEPELGRVLRRQKPGPKQASKR
jgi:transposase